MENKRKDLHEGVTSDYFRFKILDGNRDVLKSHVNKIKESMKKFGWIGPGIIVNEKFEIIDGQTRFYAAKELGLPIPYFIEEGTGLDECLTMNVGQQNWTAFDFMKSKAKKGENDYVCLYAIYERYKKFIPFYAIGAILQGMFYPSGSVAKAIKDGVFKMRVPYSEAVRRCDYVEKFMSACEGKFTGRKEGMATVIAWLYTEPEVDEERLIRQFEKYGHVGAPFYGKASLYQTVQDVYNYKCPVEKKIYLYAIEREVKLRKAGRETEV